MYIVNRKDVAYLTSNFSIFENIHNRYGEPPNWQRPGGFETLVLLILEQQVSLASARAHFDKLKSYVGEIAPQKLLVLTDEEFRTNYISRQKTSYLRALSEALTDQTLQLDRLHALPEEEVRQELTKIKGIGNWTADVYLMSGLQFKDIFPIGDIALFNTMKELTGMQTKEEMLDYAEKWRPLRSLATYFLWHHYLNVRNKSMVTVSN